MKYLLLIYGNDEVRGSYSKDEYPAATRATFEVWPLLEVDGTSP